MKNNILEVSFDNDSNVYCVNIPNGSSVNETAFAIFVVVKCLVRDGYVKESKEFLQLVDKYLNDVQYEEVSNDEKT